MARPDTVNGQKGFAYVMMLSLIPLLLSGFLFLLFSQFLLQNWMKSLSLCRTELLLTQKEVGAQLQKLMGLNPIAKTLRARMKIAQLHLAMALQSGNPAAIIAIQKKIHEITRAQEQLDDLQKSIVRASNQRMRRGQEKVFEMLKQQNQQVQAQDLLLFRYHIRPMNASPQELSVQPDRPDRAPIYELKHDFESQQALHVSWISKFQTTHQTGNPWIQNQHKKIGTCGASISQEKNRFKERLRAVK